MKSMQFLENHKFLPVLTFADITATATATAYVDLSNQHWASWIVPFGAITGDTITVTVEASTAASSNATEAAVPFNYRLTSAVATDTLGAITAATSAGATITASDDNKVLWIDVDPAALPSNPGEDHYFARVVISPGSDMSALVTGAIFIGDEAYPQNVPASAT